MDIFSSDLFSGFEQHGNCGVSEGEDRPQPSSGRKRRLEETIRQENLDTNAEDFEEKNEDLDEGLQIR